MYLLTLTNTVEPQYHIFSLHRDMTKSLELTYSNVKGQLRYVKKENDTVEVFFDFPNGKTLPLGYYRYYGSDSHFGPISIHKGVSHL